MDDLSGIVEVVEVGARKANGYLAHGYTLLAINPASSWKDAGLGAKNPGWVLKMIVYSVGRTADVAAWAPEPKAAREFVAPLVDNTTIGLQRGSPKAEA